MKEDIQNNPTIMMILDEIARMIVEERKNKK